MSGVGVLEVMSKAEGLARRTCGLSGDPRARNLLKELAESRAAVADLIEKASEVAKHTETLCVGGLDIGLDLIDALAKVTGGSDGR